MVACYPHPSNLPFSHGHSTGKVAWVVLAHGTEGGGLLGQGSGAKKGIKALGLETGLQPFVTCPEATIGFQRERDMGGVIRINVLTERDGLLSVGGADQIFFVDGKMT